MRYQAKPGEIVSEAIEIELGVEPLDKYSRKDSGHVCRMRYYREHRSFYEVRPTDNRRSYIKDHISMLGGWKR